MIPLLGVVMGAVLLRLLGFGGGPWRSWRAALAPPLGLMFVLTGLAHFTPIAEDLARFIPRGVSHPRLLIWFAGVIQITAGTALLWRRWRVISAASLIALLLVKLPLNWLGANQELVVRGPWPTPPFLRVPMIMLWIALVAWVGWGRQRVAGTAAGSTPSSR